jgi:serine/threonine protein kinase
MAARYEKWEVVRSIDEGGQGRLYLVKDTTGTVSEPCVLKRLKNPNRLELFKREIEALQKVLHPNILRVYDYDLNPSAPYWVAEYCTKGSLEDVGADQFKGDIESTVKVLLPIVEALKAAHRAGVIHRDVKPKNILVRADGTPVLGDFGICHMEAGERVTLSDEAVGSLNYIAPEMESGQHRLGGPTDRTDVYSLGKVLYWMLSGGKIFSREDHRTNSLVGLLGDKRFEHVHHWLLDRTVVRDPNQRRHMDVIDQGLQLVAQLITGDFAPLRPSLGLRCRFCGVGTYSRHLRVQSQAIPMIGLTPSGHSDVGVLTSSHCGHAEVFDLRKDKIQDPDWWNR